METLIQIILDIMSPITIILDGDIVNIHCAALPLIMPIAMGISALAAGGTAFAGAQQNKKSQAILDDQLSENEQRYLREYYRGALDNDASKAYLKRLSSEMEKRDKALENTVVATGATHENALAQKQANNEVMSDAIAGLVEREDARKRDTENQYLNFKNQAMNAQISLNAAKANNWANLGKDISSAAGTLASAYMLDGKVLQSQQNNSSNPYWNNKLNNLM